MITIYKDVRQLHVHTHVHWIYAKTPTLTFSGTIAFLLKGVETADVELLHVITSS